jgi:hypothetical protein
LSIFDHLGSVRCSLKQDGSLIGYRDYEHFDKLSVPPFGAPISDRQWKSRLGIAGASMSNKAGNALRNLPNQKIIPFLYIFFATFPFLVKQT